jgi:hypothetical protein
VLGAECWVEKVGFQNRWSSERTMNLRPTNHQYRSSRRAIFVNSFGATNLPPSHQVFLNRLYLGIGCALKIRRASMQKIRRPKSAPNLSVTDYGLKSIA